MRSQACEVPESLGNALSKRLLRAINRQIGMDFDRMPRQDAILLPLVDQFNWLFNRDSARSVAAQQFANRFYGFGMCFYCQF